MDDATKPEKQAQIVTMSVRDMVSIVVLGAAVGFLIWGIGLALNRYIFDMFLCQGTASSQCSHARDYAAGVAVAVGSVVALMALIRLRVFRPLLVVLAVAISLWGIVQLSWTLPWFQGGVVSIVMYLLAFSLFAWVARLRYFVIALAATILLIVAVRLVIML